MILLRRRNPNILSHLKDIIGEIKHPIDTDRILKLDSRHIYRGIDKREIRLNSFHHPLREEIQKASLVAYKNNWYNHKENVTVLKFRYEHKELNNYLDILKEIPIFTKLLYHDKRGNVIKQLTYNKTHYIETIY